MNPLTLPNGERHHFNLDSERDNKLAAARVAGGRWLVSKYRTQAAQHGTYKAALNMKKQGVPVELAALVLATRNS